MFNELNNLPLGSATVAALDLNNQEWKQTGVAALPVQLHHHDGFWDETTGKYLVFGGFGNKRFNNTFLEYDIEGRPLGYPFLFRRPGLSPVISRVWQSIRTGSISMSLAGWEMNRVSRV